METLPHKHNDYLELKDKIDELLLKAQSITSCLLTMNHNDATLCKQYWHGALWAVDSYLDELAKNIHLLEKYQLPQLKNLEPKSTEP